MRVIGYIRVSTVEQGESGLGLEAQRAAIEAYIERNSWTLVAWEEDVISSRVERPALERALLRMTRDDTDGLIVAKLDRLGRSVPEVSARLAQAVKEGWSIISLSPAVDMTDPYGKAMAHMSIVFAELERDMISLRTREALAAKKRRGEPIGEKPKVSEEAEALVRDMRRSGFPAYAMANRLNREGFPTVKGGPWTRQTVQRIIRRQENREAAQA